MVVCKYFLAGGCRFGNNCRYEHYDYSSDHYSYRAPGYQPQQPHYRPQPQYQPQQQQKQNQSSARSRLVEAVITDASDVLSHNQYPLSCYSPIRGSGCLPGFIDISPEEMRCFIAKGVSLGKDTEYKIIAQGCLSDSRERYSSLSNPPARVITFLKDLEENTISNQSSELTQYEDAFFKRLRGEESATPASDKATAVFASAAKNIPNNPFQNANNTQNANPFSNNAFTIDMKNETATEDRAALIFRQAAKNIPTAAPAVPDNPFLSSFPFGNTVSDMKKNVYSKPEALTVYQREAFLDDVFHHGFIPEIAPTEELSYGQTT